MDSQPENDFDSNLLNSHYSQNFKELFVYLSPVTFPEYQKLLSSYNAWMQAYLWPFISAAF